MAVEWTLTFKVNKLDFLDASFPSTNVSQHDDGIEIETERGLVFRRSQRLHCSISEAPRPFLNTPFSILDIEEAPGLTPSWVGDNAPL